MKYTLTLLLILLPLAAIGQEGVEVDPEVKTFLAAWAETMKDVRTLRVEFTQTKKLRIMRRPLVSKGTTLLKDKRVLMVVNGRDGKRETELLVADGKIRMYYPRLKRLEIYPLTQGGKGPRTPFILFGEDLESLPRDYTIALSKVDGLDELTLTPRDPKSPIKVTRMRFRDHVVVSMTQVNKRGDRMHLEVHIFEKNAPIDDAAMILAPAKGTKVVDMLKKK